MRTRLMHRFLHAAFQRLYSRTWVFLGMMTEKAYPDGKTVFSQGDPANGFYIITAGAAKVVVFDNKLKIPGTDAFGTALTRHVTVPNVNSLSVACMRGTSLPCVLPTILNSALLSTRC